MLFINLIILQTNPKKYIMLCIEKVTNWFWIIFFNIGESCWLFCFVWMDIWYLLQGTLKSTSKSTLPWLILCVGFQTPIWAYYQLNLFIACPTNFGKTRHFLLVACLIYVTWLDVCKKVRPKPKNNILQFPLKLVKKNFLTYASGIFCCYFDFYPWSLSNKTVFRFSIFVWQPKHPCKVNTYLYIKTIFKNLSNSSNGAFLWN